MTKIAGSGSGSISHGSANPDLDPDPPQNVIDPQHCFVCLFLSLQNSSGADTAGVGTASTLPSRICTQTLGHVLGIVSSVMNGVADCR
jgi:hypothetical protein